MHQRLSPGGRPSMPCFLLMSLRTKYIALPSTALAGHSYVQRLELSRGHSGCFMLCFALRPVLQPDVLLQLMLSADSINIFSHHGISLKNIIKSNITWFQLVVYLLQITWFILLILAYSLSLLIHSVFKWLSRECPPLFLSFSVLYILYYISIFQSGGL
jgi:hypothetical protein